MKHNQKTTSSPFSVSPEGLTCLIAPNILKDYWLQNRKNIINNEIFDGREFYVNQDTVLNARYVVDVIQQSFDDWLNGEQTS